MRKRSLFIWGGLFVVFSLWLATDPDLKLFTNMPFGASLVGLITILVSVIPWLVILHMARKALFDYDAADFRELIERATESSTGAGLALVGFSIAILAISVIIAAVASVQ